MLAPIRTNPAQPSKQGPDVSLEDPPQDWLRLTTLWLDAEGESNKDGEGLDSMVLM